MHGGFTVPDMSHVCGQKNFPGFKGILLSGSLAMFFALTGRTSAAPFRTNDWQFTGIGCYLNSSPAVGDEGVIYISTVDGRIMAINPNATLRWEYRAGLEIKSSPSIGSDGTVYTGCRDRNLYAITRTGKLKWKFKTGAWVDATAAIGGDGTVYFGSWDKTFYALNADGTKRWAFATDGVIDGSAAIGADGTIYFGSHDRKFYALNHDGTKKWEYETGGAIVSSPAIGPQGTIYISSENGKLHALNDEGTRQWVLQTGGITESSPVVGADGTICIGVNNGMWTVDPAGNKKWDVRLLDPIDGAPLVDASQNVYVPTRENGVTALDAKGEWLWVLQPPGIVVGSPTLASGGMMYVLRIHDRLDGVQLSGKPVEGSWTMFQADQRHTGRARLRASPH